jgi:hypothetical protein
MKISIAVAALTLGLAAVHNANAQSNTVTRETTITVGSTEPSPESPMAARKEAAAALAQAKRDCRKEPDRDAQNSCLSAAHDDYRKLMAEAGGASMRHP